MVEQLSEHGERGGESTAAKCGKEAGRVQPNVKWHVYHLTPLYVYLLVMHRAMSACPSGRRARINSSASRNTCSTSSAAFGMVTVSGGADDSGDCSGSLLLLPSLASPPWTVCSGSLLLLPSLASPPRTVAFSELLLMPSLSSLPQQEMRCTNWWRLPVGEMLLPCGRTGTVAGERLKDVEEEPEAEEEEKEEIEREVVDVRHGRVAARRDPVLQPRISSRLRGDPTRLRRGVPAAGACGEAGTGRWRNIGAGA